MAQKNLSPRNNHVGGVITNKRKRGGSYLVTAPLMKGGQA
jgi:hypothetical protein